MTQPTLDELRALPEFYRLTIPPEYIDPMGHMNIRWYMACYDEAGWNFFISFGMTPEYYEKEKRGGFALKQFIRYLAEVHEGETVSVHIRFINRSDKRIHFMQFMINETTNTLASTIECFATHADLVARRSAPFPPEITANLDVLLNQHQQLVWEAPLSGAIKIEG